jgi:RHS repeat-associated protein
MDIASASGGNVYMKLSTGSGFNSETWPVSNLWGSSDYTRAGDFNGDGLMDIVSVSGGNAYMKLSTGTNFVSETWAVTNIWGGANATWISDFNGDGLFDIATAKDSNIYINQSTGTGFVQTVYSGKGDFSGATEFRIGDFTGDANMDIISVLKTDICMKQINPSTLNRITKVTKGYRSASAHGAVTQLQYLPITDNSIYEKGTGAVYPVYDVQAPMYVVSALGKDNGAGGEYWSDYTYAEARSHRDRGFLGFRVFESYDRQTQLGQIEILEQAFPWTGSQISSETYYSPDPVNNPTNVQMLKEVRNTWLYDTVQNGTIFPYVAKSVEKKWEFGETDTNNTISEVTSYNWFDSQDTSPDTPNLIQPTNGTPQNIVYGNITKIVMDYGNGAKQISSNSYFSVSTNAWLLGRLSSASVTHQLGTNTITKTSAFDYDATTGLLMEEQVEPGNATLELTTDYQYDGFGNITNKIVSAPGIAARSVQQSDYAAGGRFVSASRNILGHSETYQYDQKTGLVTAKTGPNGLTTSMEYDPLGRAVRETRADGTETTTTYAWDNSVIVTGPDPAHPGSMLSQTSSYKITKQSSGSAPATAWYDKQGREIRQMTLSPSGNKKVCQDTVYNGLGQAVAVSENYFLGETHKFGTSEYDALGRKQYLTTPDGTVTEYVYNGLTNQVVADSDHRTTGEGTPQNQTKTTVQNAQGQTLEVIDNLGNALTYQYDAAGNLIATTDAASNTVEMVYDIRGNKIQQIDPDMGTWSYTYNALGELVSQTDAKNQTLTMEYDTLGRMIKRTTPEGEARWFYDGTDAGCWLGSLRREELRDTNGDLTYRKTYAYDSYGRPMLELYNFDNKWYYTCYRYDQYSRLKFTDRFWRPQSVVESGDNLSPLWNVFTTVNSFNSYGVVTQVSDSTGHTWWKIDARDYDVKGHLLQYTLGNGTITAKSYDADTGNLTAITCRNGSSEANDIQNDLYHLDRLGNLQSRRNLRQILLKEDFVYDGLNRLTQSTVTSSTNSTGSTVAYDATGNILSKTGVGDYTYGQSAGPHAVTSVSTSSTNSTVLTSYTYDLNGNMLGRQVDGSNTLTTVWTSFNKPSTIYSGLNGSTFAYDINNNRIRQIIETDDGLAKTVKKKLYIAGMEQDEQVANPTNAPANWTWEHKETRIFINTPSGTVGICIETPSSLPSAPCSIARKYFHTDHLGSIVAVTGEKIGDTAPLLAEYSYDAWGARRDATTWEPLATRPSTLATDRGFTGHEMLDHLGLVHMNGRIYDPTLGRFLSADPTIQFPGDLQSYNRYTYTNNNPLRYVDPSGYGFFSSIGHFFKKYWKVIVVVVIAIVVTVLTAGALAPYMASWIAWAAGSIAGTFVAGVTGSVLNGGNFGDALRAGLTGVKDSLTDWKSALIALGASYLKSLEWVKYCKMLANGVTTTIISMVQKSVAFVQGMVPEYIDVGKILAAALVGGCASVVGGGKFENGAVTGAFVVLVSAGLQKLGEMHHARNQKNDEFWRSKGLSKGRDDVDIEQFGNLEKGDKGFIEVKAANAHQIGAGNEHNIKITTKPSGPGWWNKFGRHEIILRPNANGLYSVVTDSVNMGTLNYGQNIFSHTLLDVIPYLAYGNVPNPTTSLGLRTGGLLNGNKGYQQASAWGF